MTPTIRTRLRWKRELIGHACQSLHYWRYCWEYSPRWQVFYGIKAIICIALGWQANEDDDPDGNAPTVAHYNDRSVYCDDAWNARAWETLRVGYGVVRNWYYYEDGDCNY